MESKISKILDHADKLSVIENQKEILLRQFEEDSIFYFNGQQITVTPTLIATVKSYVDLERQTITILDDFKNPIGVGNPEEFLMKISICSESHSKKFILPGQAGMGPRTGWVMSNLA